jgi:hypothetical protein
MAFATVLLFIYFMSAMKKNPAGQTLFISEDAQSGDMTSICVGLP